MVERGPPVSFLPNDRPVLAELVSGNRLILPEAILAEFPKVECFTIERTKDGILLRPVRVSEVQRIQQKLAASGVSEVDVADAVAWARRRMRRTRSANPAESAGSASTGRSG